MGIHSIQFGRGHNTARYRGPGASSLTYRWYGEEPPAPSQSNSDGIPGVTITISGTGLSGIYSNRKLTHIRVPFARGWSFDESELPYNSNYVRLQGDLGQQHYEFRTEPSGPWGRVVQLESESRNQWLSLDEIAQRQEKGESIRFVDRVTNPEPIPAAS